MVADDIVDGDADGKGDAAVNALSVNLFSEEFLARCLNDGGSKLAEVDNLGTGDALLHEALQGQIDDLGGFLVLGTDVTISEDRLRKWCAIFVMWQGAKADISTRTSRFRGSAVRRSKTYLLERSVTSSADALLASSSLIL